MKTNPLERCEKKKKKKKKIRKSKCDLLKSWTFKCWRPWTCSCSCPIINIPFDSINVGVRSTA